MGREWANHTRAYSTQRSRRSRCRCATPAHETVTIEYFEVSELIWNACVAAARAHDLLLWNEASARRIVLRAVFYAVDCGSCSVNNRVNLIELPKL